MIAYWNQNGGSPAHFVLEKVNKVDGSSLAWFVELLESALVLSSWASFKMTATSLP